VPYICNVELPAGMRRHLPHHAQDIYWEAFNNAWDKYLRSQQLPSTRLPAIYAGRPPKHSRPQTIDAPQCDSCSGGD
jgi:hypothetical protein